MHDPSAHTFREQTDTNTCTYMMEGLWENWVWMRPQWDRVQQKKKKKKNIPGNELVQLKLREANGITHALQIIRSYSIINVWNELNKETNIGNINVFSQKLLIWRNMATSKVFSINKILIERILLILTVSSIPRSFFFFPLLLPSVD